MMDISPPHARDQGRLIWESRRFCLRFCLTVAMALTAIAASSQRLYGSQNGLNRRASRWRTTSSNTISIPRWSIQSRAKAPQVSEQPMMSTNSPEIQKVLKAIRAKPRRRTASPPAPAPISQGRVEQLREMELSQEQEQLVFEPTPPAEVVEVPRQRSEYLFDEDGNIRPYNGEALERYFEGRWVELGARAAGVLTPLSLWLLRTRLDNMEELGPTFVKIGQSLSLRPDVVQSPAYLRELEGLQDSVGTFPTEKAFEIIKEDLKRSPKDIFEFESFDPIASASIGQVYRARLREPVGNVSVVAVKVQRPDALNSAIVDMYLIRRLAAFVKKTLGLRTDLVGVVDQFGKALFGELDYNVEAANQNKFRDLYSGMEITVPKSLLSLTSRRVLTTEWLQGEKGPWEDGQRMVEIGLKCSIKQILSEGYFHADPHRGNLLRTPQGNLGYLDFGLMASITEAQRNSIVGAAVGLQNQEWRVVAENMKIMGFIPDGYPIEEFVPPLRAAFVDAQGGDEAAGPRALSLGKLARNIQGLAREFPIRIPAWYSIILRTLLILEGLAISRDRNFKLLEAAYPYIIQVLLKADSPTLQKTLKDVIIYPNNGTLRWRRIRKLLALSSTAGKMQTTQMQTEDGGTQALVSRETVKNVLDFIYSDKGTFVREPLTSELIEVLDLAQLEIQDSLKATLLPRAPPPFPPPAPERDYTRLNEARMAIATLVDNIVSENRKKILKGGVFNNNPNQGDSIAMVKKSLQDTPGAIAAAVLIY
ncbi:hypothetical protein AAMO2058_001070600 [Amorphochlora amoebiformis]